MIRCYRLRFTLGPLIFAGLVSCGGSEEASELGQAPVTVLFNQEFVSAPESTVFTLGGTFSKPDSIELSQSPPIGLRVSSFERNEISLNAPPTDRPVTTALSVTLLYESQPTTRHVSVSVKNTSAASLVQQAEHTHAEEKAILELTQDFVLYRFFIDYAYLNNVLTHTEKQLRLAEFMPENAASWLEVRSGLDSLIAELAAYQTGRASDQALQQSLSLVASSILEHGRYGARLLQRIQPMVELLVPGLSSGELSYVPQLGVYSRVLNTPQYGAIERGVFQVAEAYAPVQSLIRSRPAQSLMCEVF